VYLYFTVVLILDAVRRLYHTLLLLLLLRQHKVLLFQSDAKAASELVPRSTLSQETRSGVLNDLAPVR